MASLLGNAEKVGPDEGIFWKEVRALEAVVGKDGKVRARHAPVSEKPEQVWTIALVE